MAINPKANLSKLKDKFLYYPIAGSDIEKPVFLFRDYISTFWFIDIEYFNVSPSGRFQIQPLEYPDFTHVRTQFTGPTTATFERRETDKGRKYRYLEPGYCSDYYLYGTREICINRRRGFGFNCLFGPTTLPLNINDLGIFFYRGDSFEGGSSQLWMSTRPSRVLAGLPRIPLLSKIIDSLPDHGLLITDGSNHTRYGTIYSEDEQYNKLWKYHNSHIEPDEAVKNSQSFKDSQGNQFSCIGHAGMGYGPTLIWQIHKPR